MNANSKLQTVDYDPFAGADVAVIVPTTEPQREIWLADQLSREASLAYNESISLRFTGPLDVGALRAALRALVERHDALRATISANGENLCIAKDISLDVPLIDLSKHESLANAAGIEAARRHAVETQFDLEKGPLFRAEILRVSDSEHTLIITAHHIVCDGWSFGVVLNDLAPLYAAAAGEEGKPLLPAESYADYSLQQNARIGTKENAADEAYWLSRFSDIATSFDLPADRLRSTWRTFTSRREDYVLDAALVSAIRKAGASVGASLFATLLGALTALVHRLTSAEDIVIGIPAAGQSASGLDNLVGHCVNLLPMRVQLHESTTFKEVVAATRTTMLDGYEHQSYTLGTLLKKIVIERDPGRLPLINVVFNIDPELDADALGFPGLRVAFESNARSFENFELFINVVQQSGTLCLEWQYNADLFDAKTIKRWCSHFESLLRSAVAMPDAKVGELTLLSGQERTALLNRHPVKREFAVTQTLTARFTEAAAKGPNAIAVTCDGSTLTYAELDQRSNQLAHHLKNLGVTPDTLVGLHLERSLDLLVSIVGILKAGAAYLPLDPSYPADRLKFILEDAQSPILVTQKSLSEKLPLMAAKIICVDTDRAAISAKPSDALSQIATPDNIAYVIYTSGSTGKPKGVQVTHRNVMRLFCATDETYHFNERDVWTLFHSFAFDFSVWEIWGALLYGGKLVVVPFVVSRSPEAFHELLALESVTVLNQTPSAFRQLVAADQDASREFGQTRKLALRYVIFGGEALDTRSLLPWYERYADEAPQLINMYGITETTVHVTYCKLSRADALTTASPIGEPIPDLSLYLLDCNMEPVPIGVQGELYIGGAGLARGYLNRADLTAERFICDPFCSNPGARLYKSGDMARYLANGSLEFVGRADTQVKVRGHRIELCEIDANLSRYLDFVQVVTIVREDRIGDARLVSYIVSKSGNLPADDVIRAYLKATLPEYMVPAHFISVSKIPLTANGKLDKKALPLPSATVKHTTDFVAPQTELEKEVAAQMETALGLRGIGLNDDFFALGGHSLLAAHLTARLNKNFNTRLSMRHLFEASTVARLTEVIISETANGASKVKPIGRRADQQCAPLSVMQERMLFLEQLHPGRVTYHGPSAHRLKGPLNTTAFERAFAEMIRRQPSLRTCFEMDSNNAVQRIVDNVKVDLFPAENLSSPSQDEREATLRRRLDELTAKTFDLTKAPMFCAHMFRLGPEEHVLFFMAHHIIWDGWSFDLLYSELSQLYGAFSEGRVSPLQPLARSYGDFAVWHREWMESEEFQVQLRYWRTRLKRIGVARELPTDLVRRPGMSGVGSTEWIVIDKATTDKLHEVALRAGVTLFHTLLGVYSLVLYDYARQTNLVIGTPVRGRNVVELESIMGYFNNLLPLQLEIEQNESFAELIKRIKTLFVESLRYADVPLEQLANELAVERGKGGFPLYQALFSFQDARQRITQWGALQHEGILLFQRGATEDLGMWFVESGAGLHGGVTYNTDILTQATAQRLRKRFFELLDLVISSETATVSSLVGLLMPVSLVAKVANTVTLELQTVLPVKHIPPSSETEKLLSTIWCFELGLPAVSAHDNFFDLGGHSLLAMQVMIAMEQKTGKRVNPNRFIFESLAQIARGYDEIVTAETKRAGGMRRLFSKLIGGKNG